MTITDAPGRLREIADELRQIAQVISQCLPAQFDPYGGIQEAYDRTGAMSKDAERAAMAIDRAIRDELGGE